MQRVLKMPSIGQQFFRKPMLPMTFAALYAYNQMKQNQEQKNECGGLLICVTKEQNARDVCQKNASILQKAPYQQCGLSFRNEKLNSLTSQKFTSLTSEQQTMAMVRVSDEEYMLQNKIIVEPQDDCFYKMNAYCDAMKLNDQKEEEKDNTSKICIMHSRYASKKGTMRDNQANPVFDTKNRVAVFHNGFITN